MRVSSEITKPPFHPFERIRLFAGGAYFVTICTQTQECLFRDIVDDEMALDDAGEMIHTVWDELPKYYTGVDIDVFQVMPNHVHGFIVVVGAVPPACPDHAQPSITGQPQGVAPTEDEPWRI